MGGRALLDAIVRGDLSPPPICHLIDFAFTRIDEGRVEMVLTPQESRRPKQAAPNFRLRFS
jgi:hypothetical protein